MESLDEINHLADAIYRDKVLRARRRSPDLKLRDGLDAFDLSCRLAADGIRHQFQITDENGIRSKLRERFALLRRLEEHGIYQPFHGGE